MGLGCQGGFGAAVGSVRCPAERRLSLPLVEVLRCSGCRLRSGPAPPTGAGHRRWQRRPHGVAEGAASSVLGGSSHRLFLPLYESIVPNGGGQPSLPHPLLCPQPRLLPRVRGRMSDPASLVPPSRPARGTAPLGIDRGALRGTRARPPAASKAPVSGGVFRVPSRAVRGPGKAGPVAHTVISRAPASRCISSDPT